MLRLCVQLKAENHVDSNPEGERMPTYISLVNLTEQGIKEVKNAPERLQSFDMAARELGGKLVGFYLVMGQYDYVVITEAPDDQTAARLILTTIAQGSVRTQTMRAFPREEFEQIARGLQ
jgi:uncharacterized protein with GYD domain